MWLPTVLTMVVMCLLGGARGADDMESRAELTTVDGRHVLRDAVSLQAAINASIAAGAPSYTIQAGAYYFDDGSPLIIYRAGNWSLRTDGPVELWFRVTQKWKTGGVLIKECTDVTISGLTVDYDPPAHYQVCPFELALVLRTIFAWVVEQACARLATSCCSCVLISDCIFCSGF
jgi:hypothetical protein